MSATTSQDELERLVLDALAPQGGWSEDDYLWLTDRVQRPVEFTDGFIEVLPMPTDEHQGLSAFFFLAFSEYLRGRGGVVRYAPLRLRLADGKIREPDLLLLRDAADPRRQNRYWAWADLVLEIVSLDKPERDLVEKRHEYAAAGLPEYWIVEPRARTITVLTLRDGRYREHGLFGQHTWATSATLEGFAIEVNAAFAAR